MPDKFNYVKRGYDPSEVDSYINSLENVLKSYKDKDAAIKNALINAQIAADNIIKNAEIEVENSKRKAFAQLDVISSSISKQRKLLDNLQNDYLKLAATYLKEVTERDFLPVYAQINDLEEYLNALRNNVPDQEDAYSTEFGQDNYTGASSYGNSNYNDTSSYDQSDYGNASAYSQHSYGSSSAYSQTDYGDPAFYSQTNYGGSGDFDQPNYDNTAAYD